MAVCTSAPASPATAAAAARTPASDRQRTPGRAEAAPRRAEQRSGLLAEFQLSPRRPGQQTQRCAQPRPPRHRQDPDERQRQRRQRRRSTSFALHFDEALAMLTAVAVVAALVAANVVEAAQRDSYKPKDASNLSNNANAIPNDMSATSGGSGGGGGGNGNAASNGNSNNISNGNANADNVNGASIATSSAPATTAGGGGSGSGSLASGSLQKGGAAGGGGGGGNTGGGSMSGTSGASRNAIEALDDARNGPYFDKAASKNVTALLGKTAYLNCRVKNLGNKTMLLQVSWVRHRDIHLLTVGRYTYTSDQRFRAIHQPQTEDWILQIKYPQHRDSGIYECQVSTTPHMSHYIHLNVVEPSTEIIGAPDLYIESGSTINLTCVILNSPEPPAYIFWNHNNAIINYDSPRGGVSVVTNKGETTTSFLLIKSARPLDSGHYQCNPSNAKPKSVTVHVLNGEFPAAMQRAGQAHHRMSQGHYLLVYLSMYLFSSAYVRRYMPPSLAAAGDGC